MSEASKVHLKSQLYTGSFYFDYLVICRCGSNLSQILVANHGRFCELLRTILGFSHCFRILFL